MNQAVFQEQIEAAEAYEQLHVPALFHQWTSRVLDAAGVVHGNRVLDVACGTGVLARAALARVGQGGEVVGLDAGPGMLAVAERLEPRIEWREGTAESLPFPDTSFDAVVSQFGLMFFADRLKAVNEMLRVVKPGGRVTAAVWDLLEHSEGYYESVELLERRAGARAADALRAPFILGNPVELEDLFASAGAASVKLETHTGTAVFPSIRSMVEADLRGWLPIMGVVLEEAQIEELLAEAEQIFQKYAADDGSMTFSSPAHIITAGSA